SDLAAQEAADDVGLLADIAAARADARRGVGEAEGADVEQLVEAELAGLRDGRVGEDAGLDAARLHGAEDVGRGAGLDDRDVAVGLEAEVAEREPRAGVDCGTEAGDADAL